MKYVPEPFRIKTVEPIKMTTREYRRKAIEEAGYNTFLLRSEDVYIDLLTDSGTSAMSDAQWAALQLGDEAYAGSRNYYDLEDAIREVFGYRYVVPTHQGRAAEHIMSKLLIKPHDFVPGNMYFTTTRLHQELAGGKFVDVIIDEAHDTTNPHPFKGNVDINKVQRLVDQVGADRIPYISYETCVNMAGGQPISIANLKELRRFCDKYHIQIMLDNTRTVENAYFIQQREPGYSDKSVKEIVKEICSYTDGCTCSSKKDCLVNIGGFLAMNDEQFFTDAKAQVVIYEGLHTYGGMSGRDMAALAQGIRESVATDDYIRYRVEQRAARDPARRTRDLSRRPAVPAACRSGAVPGPVAGGRNLCRDRRPRHGARKRVIGARPGDRQEPSAQAGTGAADHPAPGLHPGAYGLHGRGYRSAVPTAG